MLGGITVPPGRDIPGGRVEPGGEHKGRDAEEDEGRDEGQEQENEEGRDKGEDKGRDEGEDKRKSWLILWKVAAAVSPHLRTFQECLEMFCSSSLPSSSL